MLMSTELDGGGGLQRHICALWLEAMWWVRWALKTECPILERGGGVHGSEREKPPGLQVHQQGPFYFVGGQGHLGPQLPSL